MPRGYSISPSYASFCSIGALVSIECSIRTIPYIPQLTFQKTTATLQRAVRAAGHENEVCA
eukprot:4687615-Amphidinium_carterae.1